MASWEVIAEGKVLSLLGLGHGFELSSQDWLQFLGRHGSTCEERLLTENACALRYVDTSNKPSPLSGEFLDFKQ